MRIKKVILNGVENKPDVSYFLFFIFKILVQEFLRSDALELRYTEDKIYGTSVFFATPYISMSPGQYCKLITLAYYLL